MSGFIVWLITPWSTIQGTYYFYLSTLLSKFGYLHHAYEFIWRGKEIHVNTLGVLTEPWFKAQTTLFFHDLKISFYMSSGVSIILMIWISCWLIRRGKKQAESRYIRGSRIEKPQSVAKQIKSLKEGASSMTIADIP